MTWLHAPEDVRRFGVSQRVQHGLATLAGCVLLPSALFAAAGSSRWAEIHAFAGIAGIALFAFHAAYLAGVGIRFDVPPEKVAFLPFGVDGKYSVDEKADYFGILLWSALVALTGAALRWPTRFFVPSFSAYGWLRIVHAGCGAAWCVHLLTVHVSRRWFGASREMRSAILTGFVPLAVAEGRSGWVPELVSRGVLVPVPREVVPEEQKESRRVRELLEEGNRLARDADFAGARAAFEEALRLFPDYSQARFNLAVALLRLGNVAEGRAELLRFIEADPFNPMTERARGMLDGLGTGEDGK